MTNPFLAFRRKRRAYQACFLTPAGALTEPGERVLADLKQFCRGKHTTAVYSPLSGRIDVIGMAMMEGRREVWNKLIEAIYLDEKTIQNLQIEKPEDEE